MKWVFAGLVVAVVGYLFWKRSGTSVSIWGPSPPIGAAVANTNLETVSPPVFSLLSKMPTVRNIIFKDVTFQSTEPVQPGWNPVVTQRNFS